MKKVLVLMVLGMLVSVAGWGQGSFVRVYDAGTFDNRFYDVAALPNNTIVCVGERSNSSSSTNEVFIAIYGQTGQLLREVPFSPPSFQATSTITANNDGGFSISGKNDSFFIARYDNQINMVWQRNYNTGNWITDIVQTNDNGFVVVGSTFTPTLGTGDFYALKVNSLGDSVWSYTWGGQYLDAATGVINTSDNGVLVTGYTFDSINQRYPAAIKLDSVGNLIWAKSYNLYLFSFSPKAVETPNGKIAIAFSSGSQSQVSGTILEISSSGDSLLQKQFSNIYFTDIKSSGLATYVASANTTTATSFANGISQITLDSNFDIIKHTNLPLPSGAQSFSVALNSLHGDILTVGTINNKALLIKSDVLGNILHSTLTGKIVADLNIDCIVDSTELFLANYPVTLVSNFPYFGFSNLEGEYAIQVYDTGQATINWYPPNGYWTNPVCQPNGFTVNLPYNDTLNLDIFAQPLISCPDLTVSINTPLLRRCFQNTYTVNYCNNGTLSANNPYIEIDFDQYLTINSASIPWASQTGNLYRFNLDTLAIGQCGSFQVYVTVDCDSTELGQTHCVSAHIYPDSICLPPDSAWDGSSVAVSGRCDTGDTLNFTIGNTGAGDMTSPSFFLIAEDNVMYQSGNFQFLAGQDTTIRFKGNGSTFTLVTNQVEGHPGLSFPMVSIEGCGTNNQGTFSKGFVTQYPPDDQDGFVDILCLQNVGAYDPNDKRPEPLGLNAPGYINATQPLDYTVRFQNTGTDTAFTVVIRDTLSPYLDITTLYLTGASHPYTFQIIGSNVLEWTFPNILLPDSNTNEPLSHGFVAFHIKQTDGNAPGTEITNRAGIYFDFNPPIITNTTLNTVTEDYKTLFTFVQSPESTLQLGIYPNPNNGTFSLDFVAKLGAAYEFAIYDLAGAKRFGQTLQGQAPYTLSPELSSGMYLYQLLENGQPMGMGKVVVNR